MKSICVYASASDVVDEVYKQAARDLGEELARRGFTTVYGGGRKGLMGALADSAIENNGDVVGVIPECLSHLEIAHKNLTQLHVTQDLQERQTKMADLSDAFVILPGGLGTLAEFFEVLTWKQLGFHNKPIIILNINHYWDALIQQLESSKKSGFFHGANPALYVVSEKVDKVIDKIL